MRFSIILMLFLCLSCNKDALITDTSLELEQTTSFSFKDADFTLQDGMIILSDEQQLSTLINAILGDIKSTQGFFSQLPDFTPIEQQYNTEIDEILNGEQPELNKQSKVAFIDYSTETPTILRTISDPIFEQIVNSQGLLKVGEEIYYFTPDYQYIIDYALWQSSSSEIIARPADFVGKDVTRQINEYNRPTTGIIKATAGSCTGLSSAGTVEVEGKIMYKTYFVAGWSYVETKGYIKINGFRINADFDLAHVGWTFINAGNQNCLLPTGDATDSQTSTRKLTTTYDRRITPSPYRPSGDNDILHQVSLNGQLLVDCISQPLPCF